MSARQAASAIHRLAKPLVLVARPEHVEMARDAGAGHVALVDPVLGPEQVYRGDALRSEWAIFESYILAFPSELSALRDGLAMRLGDDRCRQADWLHGQDGVDVLAASKPMWTDEIATLDDIPDEPPEVGYKSGLAGLDDHGFRFVLPAFMSLIGPYGSGKSVLLRQVLVSLWKLHGWKFLLTSFEERVKPRYLRDLRRHFLGAPMEVWTDAEVAEADDAIRKAAVFLRRKRGTTLDLDRLLDRIEFAVRVYGVRVVAIDPVNEIDHQVPKGESKTDYMGRFIMALKQLADDYGLLVICCAHPPKDGVEKRLSRNGLLTLNDGADTAHWGNKSDIGWCAWRNLSGPTMLHIDKLKNHEVMGEPTLAKLVLDKNRGCFEVTRVGYDILDEAREDF